MDDQMVIHGFIIPFLLAKTMSLFKNEKGIIL